MDGAWTLLPSQTHLFFFPAEAANKLPGKYTQCSSFVFTLKRPPVWRSRKQPWDTSSFSSGSWEISDLFYMQKIHTLYPALFLLGCFTFLFPKTIFFNLFIACFSWLILTFHFSLLVLYDLLFPSFFFCSVMAALPVVLLWGPEFPLANETRAAYLPCFCNPAVSFLKYKLIFIQWSSCAGSDPFRGDCILWQQEGGKK